MTALVGKVEHSWVCQALRKRLRTLLTASQVIQAPRIGMRRKNKQTKKKTVFRKCGRVVQQRWREIPT